jgi:hypothetical protein
MTRDTRKRGLRTPALLVLLIASTTLSPATSRGSDLGMRVGYFFDAQALSIGMEVLNSIDSRSQWFFNPNVEMAMGDERNVAAFNGDFHYDLETNTDTAVWLGAGPAMLITDPDGRGDDTEIDPALNLLFGAGAKTGSYRPFIQLKGILSDQSDAALSVGLRF